jgi:hypothetical protein
MLALLASTAMASVRAVDVAGFYPTALHGSAWMWQSGRFVSTALGLSVGEDGAPVTIDRGPADGADEARRSAESTPPSGRAAAALVTALSGVALPLLLARPVLGGSTMSATASERQTKELGATVLACAVTLAASIVLFHSAAAGRSPAMLAAGPSALLLVWSIRRYGSDR